MAKTLLRISQVEQKQLIATAFNLYTLGVWSDYQEDKNKNRPKINYVSNLVETISIVDVVLYKRIKGMGISDAIPIIVQYLTGQTMHEIERESKNKESKIIKP